MKSIWRQLAALEKTVVSIRLYNLKRHHISIRQGLKQKDLMVEARRLLEMFKRQHALIERLERDFPQIYKVEVDNDGAVLIDNVPNDMDIDSLVSEIREQTRDPSGSIP